MGRTQTFDQTSVLDSALALFWEKGFRGTSLLDLEQATGLKPGSLYNSFGSKKALFLSVIKHYTDNVVGDRVKVMINHRDPLVGIREFFTSAFESVPTNQLNGCLLTNTATEICIEDEDIRAAVKASVSKIESGFHRNLMRIQQAAQLPKDADLKMLATHLTSCFQGMEVMAKLNRNKKQLRLLSTTAVSSITTAR